MDPLISGTTTTTDVTPEPNGQTLDANALKRLAIEAGADDAGLVDLARPSLEKQRTNLRDAAPWARSVLVVSLALDRQAIRVPLRSVAANEFAEGARDLKAVLRRASVSLRNQGVRALAITGFFPMEFARLPGLPWIVSLKDLAQAAGLGVMGKNRMVLHPVFGTNHYLGAIALDAALGRDDRPLDHGPCLACNLCAIACPTGAITRDGHFDFTSCATHNYREKIGGFVEWIHTLADSRSRRDYRKRVSDGETLSWWQSLGYDANTHCDYCMAVCPAGAEERTFQADRRSFVQDVVRPLRDRRETVYVVPGSDAEQHLLGKFPHKTARRIGKGTNPNSIAAFLALLPVMFQRGQAKGLAARYHFRFQGREAAQATVDIRDQRIRVEPGLIGKADLTVDAESDSWLGFLAKDRRIVWELIRRRIRLKGPPRLLLAFGRCFPS